MNRQPELPEFVLEWCRRLGADPDTVAPLNGGINNQVFRCTAGGQTFVLKGYVESIDNPHDRFKAETEFLTYAAAVTPIFVPKLIYSDQASRSIVVEHLEGESFQEGEQPLEKDLAKAVEFIRLLNSDQASALEAISGAAADGFLRLTDHLENVRTRIASMRSEHLPSNLSDKAHQIILALKQRVSLLGEITEKGLLTGRCEDRLDPANRCLSPSDFGFHNAIRTTQGIKFFDFEFAGWDDPAKTVSDFDLQPRIPISPKGCILRLGIAKWSVGLEARSKALFPILKLKWACIILGLLDPKRYARIKQDPCRGQIGLAMSLCNKLQLVEPYIREEK
jgi:hypothetical protein